MLTAHESLQPAARILSVVTETFTWQLAECKKKHKRTVPLTYTRLIYWSLELAIKMVARGGHWGVDYTGSWSRGWLHRCVHFVKIHWGTQFEFVSFSICMLHFNKKFTKLKKKKKSQELFCPWHLLPIFKVYTEKTGGELKLSPSPFIWSVMGSSKTCKTEHTV